MGDFMKKKIVVKDLVAENRKIQDTFKKRLNEGFFDNVLKKVGMGAPEEVKQKKVSTMTPKEKELYDKAKAAAGTAAEDAAWAEYEAERYGSPGKSPVLGKQETPMAQELQKKTVEELAKEMRLDFSKIKMNFDGTIDYDGLLYFIPSVQTDDKKNLLLPMRKVKQFELFTLIKSDPFVEFKGIPKETDVYRTSGNGDNVWYNKFKSQDELKSYIQKYMKVGKWEWNYKFSWEDDLPPGRSDDYDERMRK
jgi:hypothetical protein